MPPKLWKYYLQATIVPAAISLLGIIIFLSYDSHTSLLSVLKNGISGQSVESFVLVLACFHAVLFAAFAATLFFNRYAAIRRKPFYSLLSWFFVPLSYLVFVALTSDETDYETVVIILCATLPYVLALLLTFTRFRRKLKVSEPGLADVTSLLID